MLTLFRFGHIHLGSRCSSVHKSSQGIRSGVVTGGRQALADGRAPGRQWPEKKTKAHVCEGDTLPGCWGVRGTDRAEHSVQRYCSHADEHVTQAADSTSGPSALGGLHDPQLRARVQWGDHAGPVGSLEDTGSLGQQGLLSSD